MKNLRCLVMFELLKKLSAKLARALHCLETVLVLPLQKETEDKGDAHGNFTLLSRRDYVLRRRMTSI